MKRILDIIGLILWIHISAVILLFSVVCIGSFILWESTMITDFIPMVKDLVNTSGFMVFELLVLVLCVKLLSNI